MLDDRLLPLITMVVAEPELPSRDRQVVILRTCALTRGVDEKPPPPEAVAARWSDVIPIGADDPRERDLSQYNAAERV